MDLDLFIFKQLKYGVIIRIIADLWILLFHQKIKKLYMLLDLLDMMETEGERKRMIEQAVIKIVLMRF